MARNQKIRKAKKIIKLAGEKIASHWNTDMWEERRLMARTTLAKALIQRKKEQKRCQSRTGS